MAFLNGYCTRETPNWLEKFLVIYSAWLLKNFKYKGINHNEHICYYLKLFPPQCLQSILAVR